MNIEPLADHHDVLPILTDWYLTEWEPYYGTEGPGNALTDLKSRCNYDEIPIGLVALKEGQVCGTVALDLDPATNLTPSVVGLLVDRAYRRRGIAAALVQSAEDLARTLGYSRIYMSTTVLGHLLERMGWQKLREVEFVNSQWGWIYVRDL